MKRNPLLAALVLCILLFSAVAVAASVTVYITDTGTKYHSAGCRHLSKSKIAISLEKAKAQGYKPCGVCSPPR